MMGYAFEPSVLVLGFDIYFYFFQLQFFLKNDEKYMKINNKFTFKNKIIIIINMEDKEKLITTIREYINIDNEIRKRQMEIKILKSQKKGATDDLITIMRTNQIDCFDVKDGKISYCKNKVKAPLSKKHLLSCLQEYFPQDKEQAEKLGNIILESRQDKVRETIKRKAPEAPIIIPILSSVVFTALIFIS